MILRNMHLVGKTAPTSMPAQHKPAFEEGCALSFARWTALQLGVENEWGGPDSRQKAQQLLEDVINWFYSSKDLEPMDLEDLLDEALQMDFNIKAEDDSPYQVARSLVNMHNQVAAGDCSYVEALRRLRPAGAQASQREARPAAKGGDDDSSSSDEGEGGGSQGDEGEAMDAEGGEGMDTDDPAPPPLPPPPPRRQGPVIDEDGFQVVTRKGRGASRR